MIPRFYRIGQLSPKPYISPDLGRAPQTRYPLGVEYSKDEILNFYRILAKRLLEIDMVYGIRHYIPALGEVVEKLEKLVKEVDKG